MNNTKSLRVRAQICVKCHVGGPGRDVNHDLIAAGHPRLQFSMSAYWEALPKHWIDADDRAPTGPNYDCARSGSLVRPQLRKRPFVKRQPAPGGSGNWPEFAEWSCSACHHDLRIDEVYQQEVASRGNLSGRRLAFDPWNHFALGNLQTPISEAYGSDGPQQGRI